MKKIFTKALIIALILGIIGIFPISSKASSGVTLKTGEIIEYGTYPQTQITDEELISELNKIESKWVSYNYYYVYDETCDGMMYTDVEYKGIKYRGVIIQEYRPYHVSAGTGTAYSYQDEHGYDLNIVYWFRFDPVKWRVLDAENGLLLSEYIMTSNQFYQNDYTGKKEREGVVCFTNNYTLSDMRKFLINDFYNDCFTDNEKDFLVPTTVNGNGYTGKYKVGNVDVTDKVFLISYNDMMNPEYGFSSDVKAVDPAKLGSPTDYTICQGIFYYVNEDGTKTSIWYTRSAGYLERGVVGANYLGEPHLATSVFFCGDGCRPAITLDISKVTSCDIGRHNIVHHEANASTCTEAGYDAYDSCTLCDYTTYFENSLIPHNFQNNVCTGCGLVMGDLNGDKKVNAIDSNLIVKIILGNLETDDEKITVGDLNHDSKINAIDVNMISLLILGEG